MASHRLEPLNNCKRKQKNPAGNGNRVKGEEVAKQQQQPMATHRA